MRQIYDSTAETSKDNHSHGYNLKKTKIAATTEKKQGKATHSTSANMGHGCHLILPSNIAIFRIVIIGVYMCVSIREGACNKNICSKYSRVKTNFYRLYKIIQRGNIVCKRATYLHVFTHVPTYAVIYIYISKDFCIQLMALAANALEECH